MVANSVSSVMEEKICPILVNGGPNKKVCRSFNVIENFILSILQGSVNCKVTVQRAFEITYAVTKERFKWECRKTLLYTYYFKDDCIV